MKKKLTAADMHDPQVIAETPWFSMRKVGIDVAPGERRDFYSIHYPRPAVGIVAIQDEKVLLIRHYRRNASRRSFASTPPTAAAISCLSPGWPPVYAGWGWMQIRMR